MEERKSWYINIQAWMVEDLHLSGAELLVFALINGFCQGDDEHPEEYNCHCAISTIAHRTGLTTRGVQVALRNLENKKLIQSEVRTGKTTLYKIADVFENEAKEVVAPVKKERKEPKGDTPSSKIKQEYLAVVRDGVARGILSTDQVALNSALINTRIKALLEKGITPERARKTFEEMLLDDFCVKDLGFELSSLCSETIFCRMLRKAIERFNANKPVVNTKVPRRVCPKCGGELNVDGLCYTCDMDKILDRIDNKEAKEINEEMNLIEECTNPNE